MTTMTASISEVNALGNRDYFAWLKEYDRRVASLPRMAWLRKAAALAGLSADSFPESLLFRPWSAGFALSVRDAVVKAVIEATTPTDSDRTEASEAPAMQAVADGRASVRPATMGTGLVKGLAPAEMLTVLTAENDARQTTDSWDRIEAAGQQAARLALRCVLADRPRMEPVPPAPVLSPIGDISSFATFALPALCGGASDDVVTYECKLGHGGRWHVFRDGKSVFRSIALAPARSDMHRRASDETAEARTIFHQPSGPVIEQSYAPAELPPIAGGSPEADDDDDDFPALTSWPYEAALQRQSRHPGEFEQQEMRGSGAGHPA